MSTSIDIDFAAYNPNALQGALQKRNKDTSGLKEVLIQRLNDMMHTLSDTQKADLLVELEPVSTRTVWQIIELPIFSGKE
jgi:hypothetical protein